MPLCCGAWIIARTTVCSRCFPRRWDGLTRFAADAAGQKSPLMAASELFCTGEYVLYQARERTTVVSCQITDSYYPLRVDYERLSHGMYALELCSAAVQPAQENERLFLLAAQVAGISVL